MNPKPQLDTSHIDTPVDTTNMAPGRLTTDITSHRTREKVTGTTHTTRRLRPRSRGNTSDLAGSRNTTRTMRTRNRVNPSNVPGIPHPTRNQHLRNRTSSSNVLGSSHTTRTIHTKNLVKSVNLPGITLTTRSIAARKRMNTSNAQLPNLHQENTIGGPEEKTILHLLGRHTATLSRKNTGACIIHMGVGTRDRGTSTRAFQQSLCLLTAATTDIHMFDQNGRARIIPGLHNVHRRMHLFPVRIIGVTENRAPQTGDQHPGNMGNGTIRPAVRSGMMLGPMATRYLRGLKDLRAGGCDVLWVPLMERLRSSGCLFFAAFCFTGYAVVTLLLRFWRLLFLGPACFSLGFVRSPAAACTHAGARCLNSPCLYSRLPASGLLYQFLSLFKPFSWPH
jgi:hypothetical protein